MRVQSNKIISGGSAPQNVTPFKIFVIMRKKTISETFQGSRVLGVEYNKIILGGSAPQNVAPFKIFVIMRKETILKI